MKVLFSRTLKLFGAEASELLGAPGCQRGPLCRQTSLQNCLLLTVSHTYKAPFQWSCITIIQNKNQKRTQLELDLLIQWKHLPNRLNTLHIPGGRCSYTGSTVTTWTHLEALAICSHSSVLKVTYMLPSIYINIKYVFEKININNNYTNAPLKPAVKTSVTL